MTSQEKIALNAKTLDVQVQTFNDSTPLTSLEEWDSLGMISLIATLDRHFGKRVSGEKLKNLSTIGDILALMEKDKE